MKTLFVSDISPDTGKLMDYFQVQQIDRKTKKDGAAYLTLVLGDRTGNCAAKMWDLPTNGDVICAGSFVKIEAEAGEYRDTLQLTLRKLRLAGPLEVSKDDYIPASKQDRNVLLEEVCDIACLILAPDLRSAVLALIAAHAEPLRDCPAAKSMHQPYLGGLMEHILGIARSAIAICTVYPQLDRDLLIAGAIVHDIGKLQELVFDSHIAYGRIGQLVGHVTLGAIIWDKFAQDLDPVTKDHMAHIIASHHGQLEWGAAKVPQTREALVFHLLDQMNARLAGIDIALAKGMDEDGFTPFDHRMGTALWNGK